MSGDIIRTVDANEPWLDEPTAWPRYRIITWSAAGLAHLIGIIAMTLYVPPPRPLEEEPITLVMPELPKPPEVKVEPVEIKPPEIKQPVFRPLAQAKPLQQVPTDVPPLPIPPTPPAPPPPLAPPPSAGSAEVAPPPSYVSRLFGHLARYKRYPRSAESARIQGTAYLRFTMDRQGRVLSYKIDRSSGSAELDEAVKSMIQRAQPLPPLPPEMPDTLEIVVPIEFSLKGAR